MEQPFPPEQRSTCKYVGAGGEQRCTELQLFLDSEGENTKALLEHM